MEGAQEPSASSSNIVHGTVGKDQKKVGIIGAGEEKIKAHVPSGRSLKRFGFSDSFTSRNSASDMILLNVEDGEKDGNVKEESSPRGVLEDCSTSIESETASRTSSTSDDFEGQPAATHWRDFFRGLKKGSAKRIYTFHLKKNGPRLTRTKTKRIREELVPVLSTPLDGDLYCLKSSWKNFALSDILAATNNFSHENLIGEGGYAEVYKGKLEDGQLVAIKRLIRGSPEEMTMDFLSELGIMVHVDHPNIAKVIGYGVEGGMHLVLQLSAHGSLASLLYGPKEKLDWRVRFKIALGTAQGLHYLHEGCQRRIIHKDIKASNILLSEDFEAQISDFGLAKWLPEQWTHHTVSKVEGTFGYLPPEFFMHGIVDEKTDVYAYGVLLLELITGKQAIDSSQQSLVMWAKPLLMKNSVEKLLDPTLADAYDEEQMKRLVFTASSCIHQSSMQRPQMNQVLEILTGNEQVLEEVKQLQNSMLRRTYSEELFDAEEYNSTKHLNDLNQHMEIVLGRNESSKITEDEFPETEDILSQSEN